MSTQTHLVPNEPASPTLHERRKGAQPHHPNWHRRARRLALALGALVSLAALYPVLAAPMSGDDQYWYMGAVARTDGSFTEIFRTTWVNIPERIDLGRINVLTEIERTIAAVPLLNLSVATGTPVTVFQAFFKLALLAGGIFTVIAFVRSMRWRASDGTLVRASRRSLALAGVAGAIATAAGAQAHVPSRNGWTAYPVSTYGAVITIFGSIALLLWLSRLVAERRSRWTIVTAITVLVLLGVSTNFRYELMFPAPVVAAVALVVVPVTDRAHAAAGRRAKIITGAAYLGTFFPMVIAIRIYLANLCSQQACYEGVTPELGPGIVKVAAYNMMSAVPGVFRGNELLHDLDSVGWADRHPVPVAWWSVAVGVGIIGVLLLLWWGAHGTPHAARITTYGGSRSQAEAILLLLTAGLAVLAALATATVTATSARSHEIVIEPGQAHRSIVVVWTCLAFAAVLTVLAIGILRRRAALAAWGLLAVVVAGLIAYTLPGNLMAMRAQRITQDVSESVYWAVAKGNTGDRDDERRCELYERIDHDGVPYARNNTKEYAQLAFQHYHGEPFCASAPVPTLSVEDYY